MALKTLVPQIDLAGRTFKEKTTEIEVLQEGVWEHPQYGTIRITEGDIDKFVQSFDDGIRKVDLAIDQEHMPEKGAAGWYKSLMKVVEDGKAKLKANIEWTKLGKQLVTDGIFKYFSPEFDFDYEDMETHENFENVLIGGALTNRPYFKSLAPVQLSENMYAGFTGSEDPKGGDTEAMTKDELKVQLAEDADFELAEDAADEEKAAFEEAKSELAKEAEDAGGNDGDDDGDGDDNDGDDDDGDDDDDKVKASERFISKAEHSKQMNELKSEMGVVKKKLRFKEVTAEVQGYVFSESNLDGVLLPKNEKAAISILMASTPKSAKLFAEFLKELPKVSSKLFTEQGGDGGDDSSDNAAKVEKLADQMIEKGQAQTYGEAVKSLQGSKPELFED